MPKKKKDDLVLLIDSLTKAEKRHFWLLVQRNHATEDRLFCNYLIIWTSVGVWKRQKY
ncbi:MAG: hypothetical protein ACOYPR_14175 [Saprospiraceae bacterium]